ncbi:peptidoglycan DD-metalloendopeptidase family protein [Sulfurimonas sp. HSL3-7]|uniref:murein hydrolase activator EnvC family protein n=1 Tax=Sulfonitrofixus jiaomeiensis TaxID=3131938 RepID=UPI0031F783B6
MRILLLSLLFIVSTLFAKEDINKQINKTSTEIKSFDKKYSSLHKKMQQTAKAIQRKEKDLVVQEAHIERLEKELESSKVQYESNHKELSQLKEEQLLLERKQALIEKELIEALARNLSINMLLKEKNAVTTESIITEEIMHELNIQTQRKIENLEQAHTVNTKTIQDYQLRTKQLQSAIGNIDKQKIELLEATQKNKQSIQSLQKDKKRYKRSINKLMAQKAALQKTLAQLNIVRTQEAQKEKESVKRTTAHAKVTKRGSSYQNVKSAKYRGKKTIAPLTGYKLVKEFGPYTDPIYKIKIYNESVTLQPTERNAKVNTVLNGKVILAKNTPLLDNVVIIKHANGLHTIYAHLDMIAPTIQKGKKVKKGAVIGRVDNELIFEVTQNSAHIDPMTLIE